MKLFNKEKGKEVVYVQLQDIMYLMNDTDLSVPASIFVKTFGKTTIVNDKNRFNFLKFDKEDEVEFFKKLDFIIDYSEYRDLTDEGLEQAVKKFGTKANNIVDRPRNTHKHINRRRSQTTNNKSVCKCDNVCRIGLPVVFIHFFDRFR